MAGTVATYCQRRVAGKQSGSHSGSTASMSGTSWAWALALASSPWRLGVRVRLAAGGASSQACPASLANSAAMRSTRPTTRAFPMQKARRASCIPRVHPSGKPLRRSSSTGVRRR